MENELLTFTFCRSDWDRIASALRSAAVTNYQVANEVGADGIYGSMLWEEGDYCQALASDIDFKLPE